jgi:hypothetical protein
MNKEERKIHIPKGWVEITPVQGGNTYYQYKINKNFFVTVENVEEHRNAYLHSCNKDKEILVVKRWKLMDRELSKQLNKTESKCLKYFDRIAGKILEKVIDKRIAEKINPDGG